MPRILLVDDDVLSLEFMRLLLEGEGLQVKSSPNVRQAKEEIEREIPDFLLTDFRLPDGDGADLAQYAKGKGVKKVFGITGLDADFVRDQKGGNIFDKILTKPVDIEVILKHLVD